MPYFRKKPVVIEAEQFFSGATVRGVCQCLQSPLPHVHTIHRGQICDLADGDWIIPEPDGHSFYPCKPDIFAASYEPSPQDSANE